MTGTIYALASARGRAGVAVVRVSGPAASTAIIALAGTLPPPRLARLARLRDRDGVTLDRALVLWFPGPGSFTGEDVAEFQIHGGPAVIAAVLGALGAVPGCRPAEAGEFTRRAFESGRLDLTAVEGLADLIAAETEAQRRQALDQADGAIARQLADWAERLTRAAARLEALIDFPDEDLPEDLIQPVRAAVSALAQEIGRRLAEGERGERIRDGLSVALIGPPNSGKSSLLNALAGREAAIVSPIAGTTRDVVEVALDLGGYPLRLADTAGLRVAAEAIEAEGIRRALGRAEAADLVLLVRDASDVSRETESGIPIPPGAVLVWNKCDLARPPGEGIAVSARTGAGLETLVQFLINRAAELVAGPMPVVTRNRHRVALVEAHQALVRAQAVEEPALLAEDLRLALRALGRVTGRVDVEDLLDRIFGEFCIGK